MHVECPYMRLSVEGHCAPKRGMNGAATVFFTPFSQLQRYLLRRWSGDLEVVMDAVCMLVVVGLYAFTLGLVRAIGRMREGP